MSILVFDKFKSVTAEGKVLDYDEIADIPIIRRDLNNNFPTEAGYYQHTGSKGSGFLPEVIYYFFKANETDTKLSYASLDPQDYANVQMLEDGRYDLSAYGFVDDNALENYVPKTSTGDIYITSNADFRLDASGGNGTTCINMDGVDSWMDINAEDIYLGGNVHANTVSSSDSININAATDMYLSASTGNEEIYINLQKSNKDIAIAGDTIHLSGDVYENNTKLSEKYASKSTVSGMATDVQNHEQELQTHQDNFRGLSDGLYDLSAYRFVSATDFQKLDVWATGGGVSNIDYNYTDGISWEDIFAFTYSNGLEKHEGAYCGRIPIAAGDNVTFTVDDENQVVKVSANLSNYATTTYVDNAVSALVDNLSSTIITVDALPETEPYMILGIKNSYLGFVPATLHVCDGLPETGEDLTGSGVQHYYFNTQDNRVYAYHASNDINSRWTDFCNIEGWELEVTSSYPQPIDQGTFYVVIPNKEDINTQAFYRVEKATDGTGYIYMPDTGAITLQQFAQGMGVPVFEEHVVDKLPATGKASAEDMSQIYVYLELSSGIAYVYTSSWMPLTYVLSELQEVAFNNNGFVSSVEEMNTLGVYILKTDTAKPTLHYYDYYANVWHEIGGEGGGSIGTVVDIGDIQIDGEHCLISNIDNPNNNIYLGDDFVSIAGGIAIGGDTTIAAQGHIDLLAGQDTGTYITLETVDADDRRIDINSDKIYLSANNETAIWGTNSVGIYTGDNDNAYIQVSTVAESGVGLIDINAEATTFYGSTIAFNSLQIGKYEGDVDNIDFMFNGGDAGMLMSYDPDGNSIVDIYGDKVTINGEPIGSGGGGSIGTVVDVGSIRIDGENYKLECIDNPNNNIYLGDDIIEIYAKESSMNLISPIIDFSATTYVNFDTPTINFGALAISKFENGGASDINFMFNGGNAGVSMFNGDNGESCIDIYGDKVTVNGNLIGKRKVTFDELKEFLQSAEVGQQVQVIPLLGEDYEAFTEVGACLVLNHQGVLSASKTTMYNEEEYPRVVINDYRINISATESHDYVNLTRSYIAFDGGTYDPETVIEESLDSGNFEFYILGGGLHNVSASQYKSAVITLSASGWSGNTYDVEIVGLSADDYVIVSPVGNPTNYAESGIYCQEACDGYLVFACDTVPTVDININILIM